MGTVELALGENEVLTVDESELVVFPDGLVGCPAWQRFALLGEPGDPVFVMQSVDDESACFAVTDPRELWSDYQPQIDAEQLAALEAGEPSELKVLCTLRVHPEDRSVTANLLGPVIINPANRRGVQVVQYDSDYTTEQPLPGSHLAAFRDVFF